MSDLYEAIRNCPYCGEAITLFIEPSTENQKYIEDCSVCCRPVTVNIIWIEENNFELGLFQENEVV